MSRFSWVKLKKWGSYSCKAFDKFHACCLYISNVSFELIIYISPTKNYFVATKYTSKPNGKDNFMTQKRPLDFDSKLMPPSTLKNSYWLRPKCWIGNRQPKELFRERHCFEARMYDGNQTRKREALFWSSSLDFDHNRNAGLEGSSNVAAVAWCLGNVFYFREFNQLLLWVRCQSNIQKQN